MSTNYILVVRKSGFEFAGDDHMVYKIYDRTNISIIYYANRSYYGRGIRLCLTV